MSSASFLNRRRFLASGAAAASSVAPERPARKPNFLFLFSDDHHWQCLGAAGNPHIRTPHIDRLAARGVHFLNGHISTAQCCPSRGILLSGLETYQSGLLSNGQQRFRPGIGPSVVRQLRSAGYDTVLAGKWHIKTSPAEAGFAKAPLWLPGGASQYRDPVLRRGFDGAPEKVPGHITDHWADTACDYLQSAKNPFLLWVALNAPHSPLYAADKYRRIYEGRPAESLAPPSHPAGADAFDWTSYYSVITHLDEAVGRIITTLENRNLWQDTVVFFLGDNGFMCGTKGINGKVVPYDESIRVPFLAAGGPVKPGLKLDMPAASVDVPATWLDYAGVQPAYPLAGRSLRQVLENGQPDREAAFATWSDGRPGALAGGRQHEPYRLVRTRRQKFIRWESGKEELYDLREDPAENRNLIAVNDYSRLAGELRDRLAARMKETADHAAKWLA